MTTTTLKHTPRHIGIVMDGNGRWAKARHRPRSFGHNAGRKAVREGVEALTLFAFSSENWQRPPDEVGALLDLFMRALDKEVDELDENGVRLRFIGDLSAFDKGLQKRMLDAMARTAPNTKLHLNVAVNYGGRWDVVQAARKAAAAVARGELSVEAIDEATFDGWTCLSEVPPLDLFIRTGGDHRNCTSPRRCGRTSTRLRCNWPSTTSPAASGASAAPATRSRRRRRVEPGRARRAAGPVIFRLRDKG
jgi:undecaprenyl diphosphate synthase